MQAWQAAHGRPAGGHGAGGLGRAVWPQRRLQAGGGAVQPSPSPSPPLGETGPRASRRASGPGSLPAVPLAPTPLQGAASPAPPTGPSAWLKGHPVSLTPGVSVGVGGACPALPSSVNQTRPTKPHCSPQQDPAPWPWGYSPHFGGQRGGRGGGRKQRQRAIYAASPRKFIFNCLLTASGGEGRPGWRCRCRQSLNVAFDLEPKLALIKRIMKPARTPNGTPPLSARPAARGGRALLSINLVCSATSTQIRDGGAGRRRG